MVLEKRDKSNRVDPINALRTFTILAVFVAHSCSFTGGVFSYKWSFVFVMPAWMAMWVFFTLSGYLAGKGFAQGRYPLTARGIGRYYYKRFIRIWLPTMFFIFLACILSFPDFIPKNPSVLQLFLFCTYGSVWNNPAVDGIGATWFAFTLMWLYLSAPWLAYLAEKTRKAKPRFQKYILPVFIICCLTFGMAWRLYVHSQGLDWFHYVYTPPYANLDLFAVGLFFAYYKVPEKRPGVLKPISVFSFLIATFSCCFLLYHVWTLGDKTVLCQKAFAGYQYIVPSITALMVLLYLFAFDYKHNVKNCAPTLQSIAKNPARLIDGFAIISFEFYLFHSLVLNRISNYLRGPYPLKEFLLILTVSFVVSTLLAFAFHKAIDGMYTSFHIKAPLDYYKENRNVIWLICGSVLFIAIGLLIIKIINL